MPAVPDSARHLVIGAGVHGLSTAWHLAEAGEEVLVVDKARGRRPARRGSPAG